MSEVHSKRKLTLKSSTRRHPLAEGLSQPKKPPAIIPPLTELTVVKKENHVMDQKIRELQNRIAYLLAQEDEMEKNLDSVRHEVRSAHTTDAGPTTPRLASSIQVPRPISARPERVRQALEEAERSVSRNSSTTIAMSFQLGATGIDMDRYETLPDNDSSPTTALAAARAAAFGLPMTSMAPPKRAKESSIEQQRNGSSSSPSSGGGALEKMFAEFRRNHCPEHEDDLLYGEARRVGSRIATSLNPPLLLASLVGSAGDGFGKALDHVATRWVAPMSQNPLEEALDKARQAALLDPGGGVAVVTMGAGAWAR